MLKLRLEVTLQVKLNKKVKKKKLKLYLKANEKWFLKGVIEYQAAKFLHPKIEKECPFSFVIEKKRLLLFSI